MLKTLVDVHGEMNTGKSFRNKQGPGRKKRQPNAYIDQVL